jgi:3-dehydroquinate dehydratase I
MNGSPTSAPVRGTSAPCIGSVQLGDIPRVVLGVSGDEPLLAAAAETGVDILELRVDQLRHHEVAQVVSDVRRLKRHGLPIIGTVRSPSEGGAGKLPAARRLALYKAISPLVDAIDVEMHSTDILDECIGMARKNGNGIILSFHDFVSTPSITDLDTIVARATERGADIIKIATHAGNRQDVARLFRFTDDHRRENLVTIAMGSEGSISRLTFPVAGSLMTYTNLMPCDGQIPLDILVDHLRLYYPAYNEEIIGRLQLLEYA